MTKRLGLLLALVPGVLAACSADSSTSTSGSEDDLRGLTRDEVMADLNVMADTIKAYYGPLKFKEQRFGFTFDKELTKARSAVSKGKTEADRIRALYDLLATLHDGHVSLQTTLKGDSSAEYGLPFIVTPVEDAFLVVAAGGGLPIKRGDELVSIDGKTTAQMADLIQRTDDIGTPESTRHDLGFQMTQRPFYINKALVPTAANAHVVLKHADGTQYEADVPWSVSPGGIAGQIVTPPEAPVAPAPAGQGSPAPGATPAGSDPATTRGAYSGHTAYMLKRIAELGGPDGSSILQQGSLSPWFLTGPVRNALGSVEVKPTDAMLAKYAVKIPSAAEDPQAADFIHLKAWKYKYEGKVVLLVRIPEYTTPKNNFDDQISWLAGLLEENLAGGTGDVAATAPAAAGGDAGAPGPDTSFVNQPADVLVVDDTANPGGAVTFAQGIASLLITKPVPALMQRQHADRRWVQNYINMANRFFSIPGVPNELGQAFADRSKTIETALDTNQWLSDFVPVAGKNIGNTADLEIEDLTGAPMLKPHPQVNWSKPLLVLHDELSGSCGDFFPGLLQGAGIKTFGARTMGLGGSVEQVAVLPNSGAILSLTRGMGGPGNADPNAIKLIENEGITPTIPATITKADFRAGFGGWVKAFNDAAVGLVK